MIFQSNKIGRTNIHLLILIDKFSILEVYTKPRKQNIISNFTRMKYLLYALILSAQLIALPTLGQTSVMSFNLRFNNPKDNENSWEYRKEEVLEMLLYYSPEIIGIQEGLENQVTYIDSVLNDYNYVGVGREDALSKGEYAAIFYKTNRLKLLESKTYWLSEKPEKISVGWDAAMERVVTFSTFKDLKNLDTLYVFNAHYDHIGKIARVESSKLILKIINERRLLKKKIIVMGDLNSEPEDEPIKILKQTLEDSYENKNTKTYGPLGTYNGFNRDLIMLRRIDYIFTKNMNVKEYIHVDDKRKNNLFLSDHLPVLLKY